MADFHEILLVSDFDATLTDHDGYLPPANLEAIEYFMAHGGVFTINTGRSLPMSRHRFEGIPMNAPLLAYNGAACYDLQREQTVFCHPLPEDCLPFMQHYEKKYPDLRLEVHCLDQHYIFHGDAARDEYLKKQKCPFVHATWDQLPPDRIKFCLYTQDRNPFTITPDSPEGRFFAALEREINEDGKGQYVALNSLPGLVEVQNASCSKGLAARELARTLGRSTLVCAGDAINDLSMLQEGDLSFVPADCDSRIRPYGFRQAADSHTGTIADVIYQLEQL